METARRGVHLPAVRRGRRRSCRWLAREIVSHHPEDLGLGIRESKTSRDTVASQEAQALLKMGLASRPFRIDDRVHRRVSQSALFPWRPRLGPTPQHTLEPCAETFDRLARPIVAGVGLEVDSGHAQLLKGELEEGGFGREVVPGALRG